MSLGTGWQGVFGVRSGGFGWFDEWDWSGEGGKKKADWEVMEENLERKIERMTSSGERLGDDPGQGIESVMRA